jgi:hypothetical protein
MADLLAKPNASDTSEVINGTESPGEGLVPVDCLDSARHTNYVVYNPDIQQTFRCWSCQCLFSV